MEARSCSLMPMLMAGTLVLMAAPGRMVRASGRLNLRGGQAPGQYGKGYAVNRLTPFNSQPYTALRSAAMAS